MIEVQTPDGRYLYAGRVAGVGGSGSLLWPEEAARYGVTDPAILAILQDGQREWEIRRAAIWTARDEKRCGELSRKFFGIPTAIVGGEK